jgi:hypothetical protein
VGPDDYKPWFGYKLTSAILLWARNAIEAQQEFYISNNIAGRKYSITECRLIRKVTDGEPTFSETDDIPF